MKKAIILGILFCIIGMTNAKAQSNGILWDAYISDKMAEKVANGILNAYPPNEREMRIQLFMNANNINSTSTCTDVLYNIKNKKEAVANFILAIFSSAPMVTPRLFFQSIGFNEMEIDMAVQAGTKKQEILKKKEEDKKTAEEKAIIADWKEHGKETMTFSRDDERYGRFHPKFAFYIKLPKVSDTVTIQPKERGGWIPNEELGDVNIRFIVGENGEISGDFRRKIKQYGLDSIGVLHPADRRFERLDTAISVPSVNYFGVSVRRNNMLYSNQSYIATVKYDKKTGKWMIKDCENKEGKLKDWFDRAQRLTGNTSYEKQTPKNLFGVDSYEALLEWMSGYFNKTLNDKDSKKYQIEFTFVPYGIILYYINGCPFGKYDLQPFIHINNIEKK